MFYNHIQVSILLKMVDYVWVGVIVQSGEHGIFVTTWPQHADFLFVCLFARCVNVHMTYYAVQSNDI